MSLNVIKCQKMSENVTEMSQKGFLTKAAYSASAALATTHGTMVEKKAVDESIDLSGSICVAQEEAATSDRASVRP